MLFLKYGRIRIKDKGMSTVNKNLHNQRQQAAAAHRDSLQKNLAHRLEVARNKGDEALIRQLEAEASYLSLD
jgi:hypothetical protein